MPSKTREIRFLLDEHYPAWLANDLAADGIDTVALNTRPELRGVDDRRVLEAAIAEGRVVVTEDVRTFNAAIAAVPNHVGVVYCHHTRFPRTRPGLNKLHKALLALASTPPDGLGAPHRMVACHPRLTGTRARLPHLVSVLMDPVTLDEHRAEPFARTFVIRFSFI